MRSEWREPVTPQPGVWSVGCRLSCGAREESLYILQRNESQLLNAILHLEDTLISRKHGR